MKIRRWIKNNTNSTVIFVFMIGFAKEYFNFADPLVVASFLILGFIWSYLFEKL